MLLEPHQNFARAGHGEPGVGDGDIGEIVAGGGGEQSRLAGAEPQQLPAEPARVDRHDLGEGPMAGEIDGGGAVGGEKEGAGKTAAAMGQFAQIVIEAGEDDMAAMHAEELAAETAAGRFPEHDDSEQHEQHAGGAAAEPEGRNCRPGRR